MSDDLNLDDKQIRIINHCIKEATEPGYLDKSIKKLQLICDSLKGGELTVKEAEEILENWYAKPLGTKEEDKDE